MPVIIDTFILRLCGIYSYLGEGKKLVIISRWDNEHSIVQKPMYILIGDLKLKEVVHLTEEGIRSMKVVKNFGRQMIAGTTEDLIAAN